MNDCTIILCGATGDLSRKKLIPAIYKLLAEGVYRKLFLIGVARDATTMQDIIDKSVSFIEAPDKKIIKRLKESCTYQQLDFNTYDDYLKLKEQVTHHEVARGMSGNRLLYLAVYPDFFCPITHHVGASGLLQRANAEGLVDGVWHRIVYEKPFGFDEQSARQINECIKAWFDEIQIYRIDHYLTKELVGNIAVVRFTNIVFEPLWNSNYIHDVQITLHEDIGIEGRSPYYDRYGVVRDVVQNHMLQLLSLVAMEGPSQLTGEYIRDEKTKVVQKTRVVDGILGQYEGYRDEVKNLATETATFALFKCFVDTPRWKDVPFYLKTGKKLETKQISITITFRDVACPLKAYSQCYTNYLSINVAPESGFTLELNAKKPGLTDEITPVEMHFCHSCLFGPVVAEAYEVLLQQVMAGEQSVSVRFDEIEYAWRLIDHAETLSMPIYPYKPGGNGPEEIEAFLKKDNVTWK